MMSVLNVISIVFSLAAIIISIKSILAGGRIDLRRTAGEHKEHGGHSTRGAGRR